MAPRIDTYQALAAHYDELLGRRYYGRLVQLFNTAATGSWKKRTHLDIGCGTGYLVAHAVRRGWTSKGIDVSDAMLRQAKARHPEADCDHVDYRVALAKKWTMITASNDVLNHLALEEGLDQVLRRVSHSLRGSGVFLGDVVRDTDILDNWEGCIQKYGDNRSFRLEVHHEVLSRSPVFGRMKRLWYEPVAGGWDVVHAEQEDVLGISLADLRDCTSSSNAEVKVFDWERGGAVTRATTRIAILLEIRADEA